MRRKSKEINIFSMSALDLFASAMGAFILIAVVALPYYLNTDKSLLKDIAELTASLKQCQVDNAQLKQDLQQCNSKLQQAEQDLQQCNSKLQQAEQDLQQCNSKLQQAEQDLAVAKKKLSKNFLVVIMKWSTAKHDVDLHVYDPEGNHYYYGDKNINSRDYPNSTASLSLDSTTGPGIEIWEEPIAKKGTYKVCFKFFGRNGGVETALVSGSIYYRDGSDTIRSIRLSKTKTEQCVALIKVANNGQIQIIHQ